MRLQIILDIQWRNYFLIDYLAKFTLIIFLIGMFSWLIMNAYLSVKLRKEKYDFIDRISNSAPDKFKERARLLMNSNISWIFASSAGHTWFSYLMLRFTWKIPASEIHNWHCSIKKIYGDDYKFYKILNFLINLWITGLLLLVMLILLRK